MVILTLALAGTAGGSCLHAFDNADPDTTNTGMLFDLAESVGQLASLLKDFNEGTNLIPIPI